MRALASYLRANALGLIAIFIALGGTGYAAFGVPHGSVGTAQLRNGAVTPGKLDGRLIGGSVRAWAFVSAAGQLRSGHGFRRIVVRSGLPGEYVLVLRNRDVGRCGVTAAVSFDSRAPGSDDGYAVAALPLPAGSGAIDVQTFAPSGQGAALPFLVDVLC